jgi:hypothetical protein
MLARVTTGDADDRGAGLDPLGRALDVEPTPVRGTGGGRGRGIVALASLALAVVVAIGLAQGGAPAPRQALAPVGTTPHAHASPGAPGSSAEAAPDAVSAATTSQRLRPAQLAAAVRDGSLEGRLVFVDGALDVTPVHCQSLKEGWRGCVKLVIPGIGVPVWVADALHPWPGAPAPGAWLVTVARTGGLVYLGALAPDRRGPASLADLERRLADDEPVDATGGSLFEARGVLVTKVAPPCSGVCQSAPPYLADDPADGGPAVPAEGTVVGLATDVPEVDPDAVAVEGTFLVGRSDADAPWQVVARYVPGRSFRVLVP